MTERNKFSAEELYLKWSDKISSMFGKSTAKERFIQIAGYAAAALTAVLFSFVTLPYTEKSVGLPLADAFLCASSVFTPGAYVGAMYGSYLTSNGTPARYTALTVIFLLRFIACRWLFDDEKGHKLFTEPAHMKLSASAVLCLLQGALHLISSGIYEGVWIDLLATLTAAPVLCGVMSVYFNGCPVMTPGNRRTAQKVIYEISMVLMFSALVFSARDIRYAGCSLATLLAVFLTLVCAKRGGFLRGAYIGALLGYIAAGVGYILPTMAIGTVSGIFFALGVLPAAGISAFAGAVIAVWINGYTSLLSFVPEAVIAIAVTSPVIRYDFMPERFPFPKSDSEEERRAISGMNNDALRRYGEYERLIRLSDAFCELSDSFRSIPDTAASSSADAVCESICTHFCDTCPINPVCWEAERSNTYASVRKMSLGFASGAPDAAKRIPKYLSEHCIKLKELTDEIKRLSIKDSETPSSPDNKETGMEYRALSEILSDLAEESRIDYIPDRRSENAVFRAAGALGFRPDSISVMGERRKRIYAYGITSSRAAACGEKLRESFSKVCKTEFSSPFFTAQNGGCMVFLPSEQLTADASYARATKKGENCSGDSAFTFSVADGYFYAVLTDGMGSGSEAANCSALAASLLEKLLRCNIRKTLAVEMLGDMLRKRGGEYFTTVDIMQLDLVSGGAEFLKSGAAASYIIRNGAVYCVNARSMPVGINRDAYPEELSFDLQDGDTVVMMSDGVASDPTEDAWVTSALAGNAALSPQELSDMLLSKASELNGQCDDMTVMTIKIKARNSGEKSESA